MTEPTKPLATGGISRSGTTTPVKITRPTADFVDKKVVCSAICKCKDMPSIGKNGSLLKQSCVSGRLNALDKVLEHTSPYKPEVNYDMTKHPPAPIMDSDVETKPHDWVPGWIKKYWKLPDAEGNVRPKFLKGTGLIRRPDVVIVKDPNKPPTQDNIKQIVEIKFPPDTMDDPQREAYEKIAGSPTKLVEMGPDNCDCDKPDPDPPKIPVEDLGKAAALAGLGYAIFTRRPPPALAY